MDAPVTKQEALLRAMFKAAVEAALPSNAVSRHLPEPPKGRTLVIGAGKASAAMAESFEAAWPASLEGLVVTRNGYARPCKNIEIIEAAHPVPDEAGFRAAQRMLAMVQGLSADDLVVALMSGGGSALLSLPADGISPAEKRAVNLALLQSGATISEINCVRKHISKIKGGRLAAAAFPARVETLVISDVPGDDLADVASGPTIADTTTFAEARAIIARYDMVIPASVTAHLARGEDETPKPGDPRLANSAATCIASPQQSLNAAAKVALAGGYTPMILGDSLEGEARELGIVMAGIACQVQRQGQPAPPPLALISGGETTVTVKGHGHGGRNVEFLLSLLIKLKGAANICAMAADTDGVDGARDVAGAFIFPDSLHHARALGLDPSAFLANNDAHEFFEKINTQLITGPTSPT